MPDAAVPDALSTPPISEAPMSVPTALVAWVWAAFTPNAPMMAALSPPPIPVLEPVPPEPSPNTLDRSERKSWREANFRRSLAIPSSMLAVTGLGAAVSVAAPMR
ncbi:hypothetical protein ASF52_09490 [Methylobacterium sp. Leaf112]|nr:hypothetical protein ASF52_09490 [Methylobacterium sp. Leaf112]